MNHLAGTRKTLCGALLGGAGADDLVVALELLDQLGDQVVRDSVMSTSVHTTTRPRRGRVPALRADPEPRLVSELDQADAVDRRAAASPEPSVEPSSTTMIS